MAAKRCDRRRTAEAEFTWPVGSDVAHDLRLHCDLSIDAAMRHCAAANWAYFNSTTTFLDAYQIVTEICDDFNATSYVEMMVTQDPNPEFGQDPDTMDHNIVVCGGLLSAMMFVGERVTKRLREDYNYVVTFAGDYASQPSWRDPSTFTGETRSFPAWLCVVVGPEEYRESVQTRKSFDPTEGLC